MDESAALQASIASLDTRLSAQLTRMDDKLDRLMSQSATDTQRITSLEARVANLEGQPAVRRDQAMLWLTVAMAVTSLIGGFLGHLIFH